MRTARNIMVGVVLILVAFGIMMLLSTSIETASIRLKDPYFFLKRQAIWLTLSGLAAFVTLKLDYQWLRKLSYFFWGVVVVLLVLVRIPGIGSEINGSWRWLSFGPITFQPSEFAKLAMILLLAAWYDKNRRKRDDMKRGFIYPGLFLGFTLGLILIEPDFGTTMLIGCVGAILMFVAGVPLKFLAPVGACGMAGLSFLIWQNPERWGRIMAFLNVGAHVQGEGWQLANSLEAINRGGLWGVGLGESIQKRFYLPEAHTDFVFAILAEELGVIASSGVVLLFCAVYFCGITIALKVSDMFGRFVVLGITLMISIQALINLGVVTGSLPTKGLALPFISYGGSSLLINTVMVSLVINIANRALKTQRA
ncbi:putative lipid II flippase FtsW [Verrucomicrobiota bacterium]